MIQLIKTWFVKNWSYVLNVVLLVMLWLSFGVSDSKDGVIASLKNEVKEYVASADKYAGKINDLNDKIVKLEMQKQKVKTEIVYIQKKTDTAIKKVGSLSTIQIAQYYQKRYEKPIVITKYGVSLPDTIAKKNIVELIEKDGCFQEVRLTKKALVIEENKGIIKDTIIDNISKANIDLRKAIFTQNKIIDNVEKSVRKEKAKKTFWQVTSGVVLAGAGYLLIVK